MAASNFYEMANMEVDVYAKVQKKKNLVSRNHQTAEGNLNDKHLSLEGIARESEYDHIDNSRGVLNNNETSASKNNKVDSTDSTKSKLLERKIASSGSIDEKCNPIKIFLMLVFSSLLVGIIALSLVFVINKDAKDDFSRQIDNLTTILMQYREANNQQQQQTIIKNQYKQQAINQRLQQQQNFINLLLHLSRNPNDRKWLTLSNGFQYRRTISPKKWEDARGECKTDNGDLASAGLRDASIRTFLMSYFLTKDRNYWIGLKDKGDDDWYWINDNARVNTTNEIWHDNEPNNAGDGEDCAVLFMRNSVAKANDVNCVSLGSYGICEKQVKEN